MQRPNGGMPQCARKCGILAARQRLSTGARLVDSILNSASRFAPSALPPPPPSKKHVLYYIAQLFTLRLLTIAAETSCPLRAHFIFSHLIEPGSAVISLINQTVEKNWVQPALFDQPAGCRETLPPAFSRAPHFPTQKMQESWKARHKAKSKKKLVRIKNSAMNSAPDASLPTAQLVRPAPSKSKRRRARNEARQVWC
jgi:hypothetical protein